MIVLWLAAGLLAKAGIDATPPVDVFDYHDGKPKKPTEEIQQELYRAQQKGIRDAIAKYRNGDNPSPVETKPLPATITRLLEAPLPPAQIMRLEDDEIAILLAMENL